MWPFKPKNTVQSVARKLVDGLRNGSIVLHPSEKPIEITFTHEPFVVESGRLRIENGIGRVVTVPGR